MRLLDKIFKKKKLELVSFNSLVIVPSLDEISNEEQKNIKKVIDEVWKLLSDKSLLYSFNIMGEDLIERLLLNTNVLINICGENEIAEELKNILESNDLEIVDIVKLEEYIKDIERDAIKIRELLIAIKNILETKRFLSISKKNALVNAYNNLLVAYYTYNNQIMAIYLEKEAYLSNVNKLENNDISRRKERIEEIAELLIPEYYKMVKEKQFSDVGLIVVLEREIEKFVFLNKDYKDVWIRMNFEGEYIEAIRRQELIYKAYGIYGRKRITLNEFVLFYQHKYNVYALCGDNNSYKSMFDLNKISVVEHRTYRDIIASKIDLMKKGKSINFQNYSKIEVIQMINLLDKIFRNRDGKFDYDYILNEPLLFQLLNALDSGIANFFLTFKIICPLKDFRIKTNEEISLHCFFYIYNLVGEFASNKAISLYGFTSDILASLFELYKIVSSKAKLNDDMGDKLFHIMPEGIVEFSTEYIDDINQNKIKLLLDDKCVLFPETMRTFKGKENKGTVYYLNDGLEEFDVDTLIKQDLTIPSSLAIINIQRIEGSIKRLEIKDFKQAKILEKREEFYEFLKKFFTYSIHPFDGGIDKAINLLNSKYIGVKIIKIVPFLEELVFLDENGCEVLVINKEQLLKDYNMYNKVLDDEIYIGPKGQDPEDCKKCFGINTFVNNESVIIREIFYEYFDYIVDTLEKKSGFKLLGSKRKVKEKK